MATGTAKKQQRGPGKPFEPGRSGNPAGRPRSHPEVRAAIAAALPEAVDYLVGLVTGELPGDPKARLEAAKALLAYGVAKPAPEANTNGAAEAMRELADALEGDG